MEDVLKFENRDSLYKFLIDEFGLTKTEERYDSKNFGNFFITLSSRDFLLRYINDRSILNIEISSHSDPTKWYGLSFIRDYIYNPENINADVGHLDNTSRVKELNDFLRKDFGLISDLFNRENYEDTIAKINLLLKKQFLQKFNK